MKTRKSLRWGLLAGTLALAVLLLGVSLGAAEAEKTVAQLRADAEKLLVQQGEMGWGSYVLGEPSDQASLYRQYSYLFTESSINKVKAAIAAEADVEKKRALEYFLHYLEVEYIGNQTAELYDIYFDLEAQLKVLVDGKLAPYRNLDGLMANEADPARRTTLAQEEYRIYRLLNSVLLQRMVDTDHRLAKQLGYDSYLDLAVAYKMFDLDEMLVKAKEFMDMSEETYLKLFDEISPIPRDQFRRSDILRVLSAKEYDEFFAQETLLSSAMKVFGGLGLEETARKKVLVHDEPLPKKVPRAVCFAIRVPQDVRLSIKPIGGVQDYAALYHEFGHALHFSNSTTPVWEYQQLGSNAVTEAYAYLFEAMPEREMWLSEHTSMNPEQRKAFRRQATFAKLYMARRYLAKVIYEAEFHRGVENPQQRYQYWLSRAYGFQLNEDESTRYLSDLDPFLYAADYAQAFYLEAMLDTYLSEHFGEKWWESEQAGAFLRQLWQEGNKLTGMELANRLGYQGYDNQMLFNYVLNVAR